MNKPYARLLVLTGALLCALAFPSIVRAEPVMVNATVTPSGSLFRYNYSVTNSASFDISAITINVLSLPNAVQNLIAPTGFNIFFDSGLGVVNFVENTRTFTAGTTVSGFQFDSPFAPQVSSFTALGLDASQNPIIFTGTTLAPAAAVPEPTTLALLAPGLLYLLRRRSPTKRPNA